MAEEDIGMTIEKEAVFVDPDLIWRSGMGISEKASPPILELPSIPFRPFEITLFKPLIVNIETLGLDPMKARIIAIGLQDPSRPDEDPIVLMHENELELLKQFLLVHRNGQFNQLIGYRNAFDFQFIFAKCMFYRLPCKEFLENELFDIMQVMTQVKNKFVYKPMKPAKMSDWSDYLFKFPKPFTDQKMMEFYQLGVGSGVGSGVGETTGKESMTTPARSIMSVMYSILSSSTK